MFTSKVLCTCSFQEQFNTQDTYHTTMTEKMARSHLIGKWIKAQRHAMKALSGLAVVALDQDLQKQVQDRLIAMVEYEEVSENAEGLLLGQSYNCYACLGHKDISLTRS